MTMSPANSMGKETKTLTQCVITLMSASVKAVCPLNVEQICHEVKQSKQAMEGGGGGTRRTNRIVLEGQNLDKVGTEALRQKVWWKRTHKT